MKTSVKTYKALVNFEEPFVQQTVPGKEPSVQLLTAIEFIYFFDYTGM